MTKTATPIKKGIEEIYNRLIDIKKDIVLIGVAGESSSGKSYLCKKLADKLNKQELKSKIIKMDDYYHSKEKRIDNNFDEPRNSDLDLLRQHILELKNGNTIVKPIHNFAKQKPQRYNQTVLPGRFIFIEGLWALNKRLRDLYDLKIYIKADYRIRYERRLKRDVEVRKIEKDFVKKQYEEHVKPMAKLHVIPTEKYADIIILN